MSKLQEYIERRRELKELDRYCEFIKAAATEEAQMLRMQSDREDSKVWSCKRDYASLALVPTVVPTDEILELREQVKIEQERAKLENRDRILALKAEIEYLSNTAKGRELKAQLEVLEEQHIEMKPQLRVTFGN